VVRAGAKSKGGLPRENLSVRLNTVSGLVSQNGGLPTPLSLPKWRGDISARRNKKWQTESRTGVFQSESTITLERPRQMENFASKESVKKCALSGRQETKAIKPMQEVIRRSPHPGVPSLCQKLTREAVQKLKRSLRVWSSVR